MPASREPIQPPAWLAWALVLGAAGLTVYAGWLDEGRARSVISLAASRFAQPPLPPLYQDLDNAIQGASQGGHLYLQFRWPAEADNDMHGLATLHWYRGTYVLYPRRLCLAPIEPRPGVPETLPVNAPLPTADWFRMAQVTSILELSWDGAQARRQRLPMPAPSTPPEATP